MKTVTLESAWKQIAPIFINTKPSAKTDWGFWRNRVHPYFKGYKLSEITTKTMAEYRRSLEKENLSPQTVKHCLALIKRIFNKAIILNLYTGQMPYFPMPSFDNQRVRYLSADEADCLLAALRERSILWYQISKFALHTGLRASEIFNLRKGHIDLKKSIVCVFDTKTTLNRVVPMNHKAQEAVEISLAKPISNAPVFCRADGSVIKEAGKIFYKTVNEIGLNQQVTDRRQKVVFHTLRHTFASWLIQRHQPLETVSRLLGHKSLQMTMRYAHLDMEQKTLAVRCLENV